MDRDGLLAFFEKKIPFNAALGFEVVELREGFCTVRIPFAEHFIGDPFRPALHGGVMSALADAAGGLAVFSVFENLTTRVSTVDLRIDYLRPGLLQDVFCDAQVVRVGNRVAVTTMVIRQGDNYIPAECRGVYNVMRPTEHDEAAVAIRAC